MKKPFYSWVNIAQAGVWRLWLLLILLALGTSGARAQGWCATPTLSAADRVAYTRLLATAPAAQRVTALTYMPLTVTIVRDDQGLGGIDSTNLFRALTEANQHFAPVGVQFYVCGRLRYLNRTQYLHFDSRFEAGMCSSRDVSGTFNLYLVADMVAGTQSVCGYAYVPVAGNPLRRLIIGCLNARNLTHELGHTFGLLHTFEGNTGPAALRELVARTNCTTAGDQLCDTPADPYGLPGATSSGCQYTGTTLDPQGTPYAPALDNAMGYTICRGGLHFTPEQVQRMIAVRQLVHANVACSAPDPAAPSHLTATRAPTGGVALTWQNHSTTIGYFVERADDLAAPYVSVGWTPANQNAWFDPAPPTRATVRYRVKPIDARAAASAEAFVTAGLSYCQPHYATASCGGGKPVFIESVRLTQGATPVISNVGSGCGTFSLFDRTSAPALQPGLAYALRVDLATLPGGGAHPQYVSAWLDLDANGSFLDAGEQLVLGTQTGPVQTFTFTLPTTGVAGGIVRLRVRSQEGQDGPATDPCAGAGGGETEDYAVRLLPTCTLAAPTLTAVAPVCVGGTVQLTAMGVPAGATSRWRGPYGFQAPGPTLSLPNATAAASGEYALRVERGGCSAEATTTVRIDLPPVLTMRASGPLTICQGDTLQLTVTGADHYRWSTGDTTTAIVVRQAGTYRVTGRSHYRACAARTDSLVVRVVPRVSAAFAYSDTVFCRADGRLITPTITGTPGGRFRTSSSPWGSGVALVDSLGRIDLAVARPGVYEVQYTVDNGCSHDVRRQWVTILGPADFFYASDYDSVAVACIGSQDTLLPTLGDFSQLGVVSATPAGLALDSLTGAIDVANSLPGFYTVTNTVGAIRGCSGGVDRAQVAIVNTPIIELTAAADTVFCPGDSVLLQVRVRYQPPLPPGVPTSINLWGPPFNPLFGMMAIGDSLDIWVKAAGVYAAASGFSSCQVYSPQLTLAHPDSLFGGFMYFWDPCAVDTTTLRPSMFQDAVRGRFSARPNGLAVDPVTGYINVGSSTPGFYKVYNTVSASACPRPGGFTDSTTIMVFAALRRPHIATSLQPGGRVRLTATNPNGGPYAIYDWYHDGQLLNGQNTSTLLLTAVVQSGQYYATVTAGSCPSFVMTSDTVAVRITGTSAAVLPANQPTVWPNPTHHGFTVGGGGPFTQVEVRDALGRLVLTADGPPRAEQRFDDALPPGLYLIRLTTGTTTVIRRLVVL